MTAIHAVSEKLQLLDVGPWERHRHTNAYGAFVLEGAYLEYGDHGRFRAEPGQIVAHDALDAHANTVVNGRTRIINFALPADHQLPRVFEVADGAELERALLCNQPIEEYLTSARPARAEVFDDWPDKLARDLVERPLRLRNWACSHGVSASKVSRGFAQAYGISPARFRLEQQVLRGFRLLSSERLGIAEAAHDCGFADQAHFTRAMRAVLRTTPARVQFCSRVRASSAHN